MNVDEYVAARYGRLLERAVELGAPEGLASEYVDQVLLDQQKAIRKAEDPDPVVHAALERAVLDEPRAGRSPWPFVGVALAAVGVAVAVVLTQDPTTDPMPPLFGYTGEQAAVLLGESGYDVVLRPVRECEPLGQVLTSDPRAGEPVERGAQVQVFTAVPSGSLCEAQYIRRGDAWAFLDFAISGSTAPAFARTVTIVIDGVEGEPRSGVGAATSPRWEPIRALVARQAHEPTLTPTGQPMLTVTKGVPPPATCGTPRPPGAADRTALQARGRPPQDRADAGLPVDDRPLPRLEPGHRRRRHLLRRRPALTGGDSVEPVDPVDSGTRIGFSLAQVRNAATHDEQHDARPQVGVDPTGLVGLGVAEQPQESRITPYVASSPPMMLRMSRAPAAWRRSGRRMGLPGRFVSSDTAAPQTIT